jgi:hypothetical protein
MTQIYPEPILVAKIASTILFKAHTTTVLRTYPQTVILIYAKLADDFRVELEQNIFDHFRFFCTHGIFHS